MTWIVLAALAVFALAVHLMTVALTKAIQSFSRSLLEDYGNERKAGDRVTEILHQGERTESAAEAIAVLSGLFLAVILGAELDHWHDPPRLELVVILVLLIGATGYAVTGVTGRVFAERIVFHLWPIARPLRAIAFPMVWATAQFEEFVQWLVGDSEGGPRPTSVEVEIPAEEGESAEDVEAELPEATRLLLQHAVELTRMDVSEMMKPASAIVSLPSTVTAQAAAETFRKSGRSRIPLFGANRDDIVGILLAKDLWDKMLNSTDPNSVVPVRIVRPALYVPETSSAFDLIGQLRGQRSQMAIVLDEYGAVAGLVTLEDLLEQLVGSIDDEHDEPTVVDLVKQVGENRYEVDASVMIEDLNDRFDLDLPTDEDYETIGGMAFHLLGRLPEVGASFRKDGIEFEVLDVGDQSIRRLSLALPRTKAGSSR